MLAVLCTSILGNAAFAQSNGDGPSLAFLEYLADMEQVNGEWMDAVDVLQLAEQGVALEEKSQAKASSKAQDKNQAQGNNTQSQTVTQPQEDNNE